MFFLSFSYLKNRYIGIVEVVKEFYQDPTDKVDKFVVVDVKAKKNLKNPVSLEKIKSTIKIIKYSTLLNKAGYL